MDITTGFFASLGTFLVLQYMALPWLQSRMESDLTRTAIKSFARFHLFAILRTVALACGIGTGLMLLIMWYLSLRGTASVEGIARTLETVQSLQHLAETASTSYSIMLFVLLTAGLGWLSYKQSEQKATALFDSIDEEERTRLVEAYQNDQWEELPSTDLMDKVEAIYEDRRGQLEAAEASDDQVRVDAINGELEELKNLYFSLNLERRMVPKLATPLSNDFALPVSARWGDRLRNAVLNRGVLKTFQGGSRVLLFLALIALLPSAVSVSLVAGVPSLEAHMVKLDELRIELDRKEADSMLADSLQRGATAPPPAKAVTVDDATAQEQILANYDQAFTRQIFARTLTAGASAALEHASVREQLLKDYAHTAPQRVEAIAGPEGAGKTLLDDAKSKVRGHLETIRRENRRAWENMKAALPSHSDFAVQLGRNDLKQALTGEILKSGFSGAVPSDIATAYEAHSKRYVSSLVEGRSLDHAASHAFKGHDSVTWTAHTEEHLRTLQPHSEANGEFFDRSVRQNPPTLSAAAPAAKELHAVEQILTTMPAHARSTQALYGYQDLLPGRLGDETRTSAAKSAEKLGQGGKVGSKTGGAAPHVAKPSTVAFQRSYSYSSLRGFSRVGGVLIGKPPENGKAVLDMRDFAWSSTPGGDISLTLVDVGGKRQTFGPFAPSLVRQALAYAADQRPLAVTMITAAPVPDLKIIAHPALVDTPMGCRAVQIDRITDEATSRSEYRSKAEALAHVSNQLYRYAWSATVLNLLPSKELSQDDNQAVTNIAQRAMTKAKQAMGDRYAAFQPSFAKAEENPVTAKKSFYDPVIAEMMMACAKKESTLAAYGDCVTKATSRPSLDSLLKRLPEFQIWSGVREQAYSLDTNLNFLRQPKGDELWPFDFVLQTAFTRQGLIGDDEVLDDTPWEFPALHDRLVRDVAMLAKSSPVRQALVNDMRNFVVTQRLFRVALNGQLGKQFPIAKLAGLSRELNGQKASTTNYKTPKWNPRNLEMSYSQIIFQAAASPEIRSGPAKELARVASASFGECATGSLLTLRSGGAGRNLCNFETTRRIATPLAGSSSASVAERELADTVLELAGILDIRRQMGVYAPENLNTATCPAL